MPKKNDPKQPPAEPSIDIRTPGLVEAFDSVGAMQAWELLRRSGTPLTAAELARIARMPVRTVQRALDRFETVALVRRHPGRKANPAVRWSVTRQTIQMHHRQLDPLDESLFAKMVTVFGTESENEILRGVKDPNTYGVGDNHWQSINAASLDNDEMRELWKMFLEIERFLHRSKNKFKNVPADANQDCNYCLSVRLMPLNPGVLPMPTVNFLGGPVVEMLSDSMGDEASGVLTARELSVARAGRRQVDPCGGGRTHGLHAHGGGVHAAHLPQARPEVPRGTGSADGAGVADLHEAVPHPRLLRRDLHDDGLQQLTGEAPWKARQDPGPAARVPRRRPAAALGSAAPVGDLRLSR